MSGEGGVVPVNRRHRRLGCRSRYLDLNQGQDLNKLALNQIHLFRPPIYAIAPCAGRAAECRARAQH